MARKPTKGDHCRISAEIAKVWPDGSVTLHVHGYGYPITVPASVLEDLKPKPKGRPGEKDDLVLPWDRE